MEHSLGAPAWGVGTNICLHCKGPKNKEDKFCSLQCYWGSKRGRSHSWGRAISFALKGKPKSKTHVAKVAAANRGQIRTSIQNANHPNWKGDKVGYDALHDWVARHRGRPKHCEECGLRDEKKMYHWANKSGLYLRQLDDWLRLCVKCHSKLDRNRAR